MARQGNLNHLVRLRESLIDAAAAGIAPLLEAAIWHEGQLWEVRSHDGPAQRFDLASLTKPLCTGLIALSLAAEGALDLDRRLPTGETPRQLLAHTAGYAAWAPLFAATLGLPVGEARARMRTQVADLRPMAVPGAATVYSDLGFLRLGQLFEDLLGQPLDQIFVSRVAHPLGLSLEFNDLAAGRPLPAAATGVFRPRPRAPGQREAFEHLPADLAAQRVGPHPGEVDDDNAHALGGVAGHAGLFGTARSVALAGSRFLEELSGAERLGPASLASSFARPSPAASGAEGARALGWDRPSAPSSLGTRFGRGPLGAVGHLGFTGCSLWLDLDRRVAIALCSNRVWLGRENQQIRAYRPRFHDAVAEVLGLA